MVEATHQQYISPSMEYLGVDDLGMSIPSQSNNVRGKFGHDI